MESVHDLDRIPLEDILQAQGILKTNGVLRTPLIPLHCDISEKKIYLKLENLQPVNSFKIRGACNALFQTPLEELKDGVYSCSAGNFAQGLAWAARKREVECDIIAPDNAPKAKTDAIERLGAKVHKIPYAQWWQAMMSGKADGFKGKFVHPVCNRYVIAGNGTVGLEILEDLPHVDTIICPWGGGGQCSGISSVFRVKHPSTKIVACEVETSSPLSKSLKLGYPAVVENHRPSFVDGMNGKSLLKDMWKMASNLVDDVVVLTEEEISDAVRLLAERNRIIAEGAGAAPVAAAMSDKVEAGTIVCIVSGGNIDFGTLIKILQGETPTV